MERMKKVFENGNDLMKVVFQKNECGNNMQNGLEQRWREGDELGVIVWASNDNILGSGGSSRIKSKRERRETLKKQIRLGY